MLSDPQRFERAIALFDAANAQDPNKETADGQEYPKELLYAQRMTEMLERFAPDAPEAVHLACRAQHIQRWKSPRSDFPATPDGYQQWRTGLYKFHANSAGELMKQAGYDDEMIERVKKAVGKRGLKVNPETQAMEDVADLVFIEHYMTAFAAKQADYSEEKWLVIIRKTWKKMSNQAHDFAVSGKLKLPEHLVPLILKAVQEA
ncbi:MAG: DUF4202 domain-containing protein [Hydrogenophilales bacterium CG03_land_8_20_14_0_80_62_28]|nr:DUF4202 domain-containing protein [Betaproteobacteria bacterium]OIO78339.1 MAG: hypothetical protein AUJ86_04770 [Hydrogenophilaceae bacterium CG1_02_62_390]PIV23823.1 MAG: DUF4202 domain-containing protein [Hydrogenophilales bacterium CG03_land_8_20_14_0_80_62_28]PIW38110.1 MAG: DUF4202 domain-containing protein [Hydrogenophilales bacterium CG15_BIG_FIL_POST_REV_8_21_14_020_62_31]PIW72319.1 MAG: DUF4202 domain-containing protein [Hydrogenophilales bacterium CG12_big_fil_rev_8_21_14_0_65_61_